MRKRLIISLFILSLFLVGCTTEYNENYLKTYKSFLKYSFGDYDIITDEENEVDLSPIPAFAVYRQWEISYQDSNDETHIFEFSNYGDTYNDETFEYDVYVHLDKRIGDMVQKNYMKTYFPEYFQSESIEFVTNLQTPRERFQDLIHKKKGINFQTLDGTELSKYGFSIYFKINIELDDSLTVDSANNTIESDKTKATNMVNQLYQDLGYKDMLTRLDINHNENRAKFTIYYDENTDEYVIRDGD